LCQARATLRKSLALRAIVRTRREPRHEFAPCVYPISSIFRCNLRTDRLFSCDEQVKCQRTGRSPDVARLQPTGEEGKT
jgi:hypothetical protein